MTIVDQVFFMVLGILDAGFAMVMPVVLATFGITFGWGVTRLCFAWLAGAADNIIGDLIGLFVVFFMFLAIAWSAKEIVDAAGNFALNMGSAIVGVEGASGDNFSLSAQWAIADEQADKILETKKALCTGVLECARTLDDRFMLELAALFIYVAFAFIIFEIAITAIGYKVNSLFMLIFTPMAVTPFTKNMAEGAIQGWLNNLVKLTIIAMVAGVGAQSFELMNLPPTPVWGDIMPAVLLAVFIAWLAWQSRTLASGIISAVPQLSSQSVTRGVGNVVSSVTGAGRMAQITQGNLLREKMALGGAAAGAVKGIGMGAKAAAGGAQGAVAAASASANTGKYARSGVSPDYWSKVQAASQPKRS